MVCDSISLKIIDVVWGNLGEEALALYSISGPFINRPSELHLPQPTRTASGTQDPGGVHVYFRQIPFSGSTFARFPSFRYQRDRHGPTLADTYC